MGMNTSSPNQITPPPKPPAGPPPAPPSTPPVSSENKTVLIGVPERWVLLSKAYNLHEGWAKSSEAMLVPGGCLVKTTTKQRSGLERGSPFVIAEALAFVPYARILNDANGGHQLAGPFEHR